MSNYLYSDITGKILKAYFKVYNTLGYGFLEKVYENAMMIELQILGLLCEQQKPLKVNYRNKEIGEYFCDILVEKKVVVELKSAEHLIKDHHAQLINYLKATELEAGLLLNFGKTPEYARKVMTQEWKKS